ncbi:MAG: tetratricopeptide repeat protein [Cyanobacteria bacterium P01_D01_bin.14]
MNRGALYKELGRYSDAELLCLKAVQTWLKVLGQDHPNTQAGIGNFVDLLQRFVQADQVDLLSDHPFTQALLQQLQQQSDNS